MAGTQEDEDGLISAINVTPLVDITLVLLIVFMVTAKIIVSSGIDLDLPTAATPSAIQVVFGVELHKNGDIVIDGERMINDLKVLSLAKEALVKNSELRAVIRADKTVQHGRIIRILDLLKQAGVNKIAFGVTPIPVEAGAVKNSAVQKKPLPKAAPKSPPEPK